MEKLERLMRRVEMTARQMLVFRQMRSDDNDPPQGIAVVAKVVGDLPGSTKVESVAPAVDAYEPDFWYPGSVSFHFECSKLGDRLRTFFLEMAGSVPHSEFPMGLTIDVVGRNEESYCLIKFYINEDCGGSSNLNERFATFAEGLEAAWESKNSKASS